MNKRQLKKESFKGWSKKQRSEFRRTIIQIRKDIKEHVFMTLSNPCFPRIPFTEEGFQILSDELSLFMENHPNYADDAWEAFVGRGYEFTDENKAERKLPPIEVEIKRK